MRRSRPQATTGAATPVPSGMGASLGVEPRCGEPPAAGCARRAADRIERAGRKVSFVRFLKFGMPVMILTIALSTIYLYLRYYF